MMGRGLAFDPSRYFIFCANTLGSPYGSSSPVTLKPGRKQRWGPEFPLVTIRDDVLLHKVILDFLGVRSIAVAIGGSMGGMQVLEWSLLFPNTYVRNIIPMATSAHHSAWGISWGEAQRQAIWSDPNYEEGYYADDHPPASGLGAARMAALLTYRSRDSFESRFGRREMENRHSNSNNNIKSNGTYGDSAPSTPGEKARQAHNDGYKESLSRRKHSVSSNSPMTPASPSNVLPSPSNPTPIHDATSSSLTGETRKPLIYSAQSYLRYQGTKFIARFDANCYIAITRKMDSHDVFRGRFPLPGYTLPWHPLHAAPPGALIIAISSDGLFTLDEQRDLAANLPDSNLVIIESPEGHDGFLLEFEQINKYILEHLQIRLPEVYEVPISLDKNTDKDQEEVKDKFAVKKDSLFGEAEADVTAW